MARTSVLTGGSNNAQFTSEDANAHATDFISDGIVGALTNTSGVAPMTGGLAANAQGTPDRTAAVTAGIAYVTATPTSQGSQRLRVKIDAQNVTHATNTSGSTKYDWVYVKVDAALAANPIADMSTTGTLVVSRSTSNVTDNGTPPTYGYHIYTATLTNGWTTLTNGNIADTRIQTGATSLIPVSTNGTIAAKDLATSAIKLGFTSVTTNFSTTTTSAYVDVTSLASTVTVPTGGRDLKITVSLGGIGTSAVAGTVVTVAVREGSTTLGQAVWNQQASAGYVVPLTLVINVPAATATAGSHTYKVSVAQSAAGTLTINGGTGATWNTSAPATILVEAD